MDINSVSSAASDVAPAPIRPVAAPVSRPPVRSAEASREPSAQGSPNASASEADVHSAVNDINTRLSTNQGNIQFSVDQTSGSTVIKLVDKKTQEVFMQIPSQQALEFAKQFGKLQGILIKEKV